MYSECHEPLGMEDETIPDDHITASSVANKYNRAANGRLHFKLSPGRSGAWSAEHKNKEQWLQVDLGSLAIITEIETQGKKEKNQWVKSYNVSYSLDGESFHSYKNGKVLHTQKHTNVHTCVHACFNLSFERILLTWFTVTFDYLQFFFLTLRANIPTFIVAKTTVLH